MSEIIYGLSAPRLHTPLLDLPSAGGIVSDLADEVGLPLLPWQKYVLDDALKIMPNGNWARSNVGVLVARQNGKTHLMRMRILAGLLVFGEKDIIAMAQTRQLSLDTFKQVVDLAESLPWARKRIKRVSRTNGQEELEIYCHHWPKACKGKCARVRKYAIRAATSAGPRGSSADLLYVDELREIDPATWGASTPLTRAKSNAQTYITSNAGDASSQVLNDLRARALTFSSDRMGWYEWSATPGCAIDDIYGWKQANPALGHTVSLESLQDSAAFDSPDTIRTEMLCQWVDAIDSPWPMEAWNEAEESVTLKEGLPTYMALDITFNRDKAYLVTVQEQEDERLAVFMHVWEKQPNLNDVELAGEIATLTRKYRPRVFAYDPNTSGYVAPHLAKAGIPVAPTGWSTAIFAIMCDQTLNAMAGNKLVHPGQQELYTHLVSCARRPASDGGWRIARRAAAVPISAAVAMVMAVGHASTPQQSVTIVSV